MKSDVPRSKARWGAGRETVLVRWWARLLGVPVDVRSDYYVSSFKYGIKR